MKDKYLLHFRCGGCGHKWSISTNDMAKTVDEISDTGCPKKCTGGTIYLDKHETKQELEIEQMIKEGLIKVVTFN